MSPFSNLPTQTDTTILFQYQGVFDDMPVCYRTWRNKDIQAESMIFKCKDLNGQKDQDLLQKIKASNLANHSKTIAISRQNPDFVVVNFNFQQR